MPTDIAEMQQRATEINEGRRGKVPFFKPKEGPNTVRLLPPFGNRTTPKVEYKKVFGLGPNKKHITPRKQFGLKDCPFEEYYNALSASTSEADKKELDAIRISNRVAFMVINRNEEETGPMVWETSLEQLATICALMSNPEWGAIDDPNTGVDLTLTWTPGNKTATGFADTAILPCRNPTPLTADQEKYQSWLGKDWFKEYHVGEASDVDWIRAVLTGEEKNVGNKSESNQTDSVPSGPVTQPPSNTAAYPYAADEAFYAFLNDKVENITAQQVYQLVLSGNDDLQICSVKDSGNGWVPAKSLGFAKPVAPPAPPAPPKPPAPPTAKETPPWIGPQMPSAPQPPAPPTADNSVNADIRAQLLGK